MKKEKRNKHKHLFKCLEAAQAGGGHMTQAFLFDHKTCATLTVLHWIFSGDTTCLYTYCISPKNSPVSKLYLQSRAAL